MKPDAFFETVGDPDDIFDPPKQVLFEDLINGLRKEPQALYPDLDVAPALVTMIHRQFEAYGTNGQGVSLDNDQSALVLKTAKAVVQRLGLTFPNLPFRDFETFYTYWVRNGMKGSYAARRECLYDLFHELENSLYELEERQFTDKLAEAISPRGSLGWSDVDVEISQLRRRFTAANTSQDYSAVGTACVRVLIAVGKAAYDSKKHLRDGETEPPIDKTKQRLTRVVEDGLPGADNAEMRKLVHGTVEVAHKVKHSTTPTRREAGTAADAVIMLANIMRRIAES